MNIGYIALVCLIGLFFLGLLYLRFSYLVKLRKGEGGMEEHEYARLQLNQEFEERSVTVTNSCRRV